jgi:uncharacterized membrane protein YqhA
VAVDDVAVDDGDSDDGDSDTKGRGLALFGEVRWLAAVAVLGLTATTVATFGLALAKTVKLIDSYLSGGWRDELAVVALLEAVDTYLLAVVQLIVVLGLFELFLADLDVPEWLEVKGLDDVKKPIVDVLIVFIAIQGIRAVLVQSPADALRSTAAVALLIISLTAFRSFSVLAKAKPSKPSSTRDP